MIDQLLKDILTEQMVSSQNNIYMIVQLLKDILSEQMAFFQNNMAYAEPSGSKFRKLQKAYLTLKTPCSTSIPAVTKLLVVEELLLQLQNASGKDIKTTLPSSPTGYYHVNA